MRSSSFSLLALIYLASHESNAAAIIPKAQSRSRSSARSRPFKLPQRSTLVSHSITPEAENQTGRSLEIATTRAGFLYGPAVAGGPFYPTGAIGNATDAEDLANLEAEEVVELALATEDSALATTANNAGKFGGLKTLDDYVSLYDDEWLNTMPNGPAPGILSNFTQDLVFSMERLSDSPYALRRLDPSKDSLPFPVDDSIAQKVAGATLESLFSDGRLFHSDHSDLASLETNGRYAAACEAYFFIDESTGDFLPLAIRTGVGKDLIYTPEDQADDWLLAKIMYNSNDIFFAQFNHLANTHMVIQITWMAAIRTLSTQHPVYAIFDRLAYEAFALQPIAAEVLYASGAAVDETFPFSGSEAEAYANDRYFQGSGAFQSNYFLTDLKNRGLIDSNFGPELNHFPFYEDALVIYDAIQDFMKAFVHSYYASDHLVKADKELQNWASEANGDAEAIDFPTSIPDRQTLIDILTHIGHLSTSAHHAVNTNQLQAVSVTLPFHPAALYAPIPTTKGGNTSIVSFLPDFEKCNEQITVSGLFSRPELVGTNRSLINMFDDDTMLSLMNKKTNAAAAIFKSKMQAFSAEVSSRTFDSDGLSQGMPFVWTALDPNVAPYSATV